MSESEYTGPRWAAVLFPVRRRKLSMRPFTSSSFSIDGMLLSTLVARRGDQNPVSMVTACTGTQRSLAYRDLARFRMPWSRQGGFSVSATESRLAFPGCPVIPRKNFGAPGNTEIADAEIAEATNFLREYLCFWSISSPNATGCCTAHIIAQPRTSRIAAGARRPTKAGIQVLLFPVPGSQYFSPTKFPYYPRALSSSISPSGRPPKQVVCHGKH